MHKACIQHQTIVYSYNQIEYLFVLEIRHERAPYQTFRRKRFDQKQ
jgi:hypothetical protein